MKTKDNTNYTTENVTITEEFQKEIVNKKLNELESEQYFLFPPNLSEESNLSSEQKILEGISGGLKTTNIMGILGYDNEQLFIGSRFDNGNDYFFHYMLKKVLNINFIDRNVNMEMEQGYLDILIILFPEYLKQALRKGLFKEYQESRYNDSNIKGKIDFKRHLKENSPFTGQVAYTTREFSYNNPVINLIRHTIEFIKVHKDFRGVLSQDDMTRENIKQIEEYSFNYKKINVLTVIQQNLKKPVRHGYYFEYRSLQLLCLAILRMNGSMYKENSQKKVYGILIDGAWLFEEYINLLIKDEYHHPDNKTKRGKEYLFEGLEGEIYPDFISKNNVNRTIVDAKYKRDYNIRGTDYLQIVAYMYRFDAKTGYFVYPKKMDEQNKTMYLKRGMGEESVKRDEEISVKKIGVGIHSNAKTFKEFEKKMAEEEIEFRKELGLRGKV